MKNLPPYQRALALILLLTVNVQSVALPSPQVTVPTTGPASYPIATMPGQTTTLMPSGSWLSVGGRQRGGPVANAIFVDSRGSVTRLSQGLSVPRAYHSATVLPDGRILVLGGIGPDGRVVGTAEVFDAQSKRFETIATGLLPRAHHTATLLTEGKVLVAGGIGADGQPIETVEVWDPHSKTKEISSASVQGGRQDHSANILPDGTVLLWGGKDVEGNDLSYGEIYDPKSDIFSFASFENTTSPDLNVPTLEASLPVDGATDANSDVLIALRFSKPLQMDTIDSRSVALNGPAGLVPSNVSAAENGMLGFVTPRSALQPGNYSLTIDGPVDTRDLPLVYKVITFTVPGVSNKLGTGSASNPDSAIISAEKYPPLQARPGITAISGQILTLDHRPLADVTLQAGPNKTLSDDTGRFLLQNVASGHQVLVIDARKASTHKNTYGLFEVGVDVASQKTNVLDYKIWMPALDMAHAATIPSPTLQETVVTNPLLPGLELRIPPNTVIYDHDGRVTRKISITPVPVDRPPFPLPRGVPVPLYFTIQPGGAYLKVTGNGPKGARLFYPNSGHALPGTRFSFWNYDADVKGWYVYGLGTTAADRNQVIPDPGVVIYEFTGAMVSNPGPPPPKGPPIPPRRRPRPCKPGVKGPTCPKGEPVDPSTGLFIYESDDFSLPDVLPITLTRTYRQGDTASRPFGMGTTHNYDIYMIGDTNPYTYVDLILPDGGRVHYDRISSGTSYTDAVFRHTGSASEYYGSTISWNQTRLPNAGWDLYFKDGTLWAFPESSNVTRTQQAALVMVQDRYGNQLNLTRDGSSNLTQITSPNGRWLRFTYDTSSRIIQATDNVGRNIGYQYDPQGRLQTVTDQNMGITTYGYDPVNLDQMVSITDARQIAYLRNHYDANGRIDKQTLANGGQYKFAYTSDAAGNIIQTDITDPNGYINRLSFASPPVFQSGYQTGGPSTSEIFALGKPEQQTYFYDHGTPTNNPGGFLLGVTDPLGRITKFSYDAAGNLLSTTRLAGTPNAATTAFSYEPVFNRIAGVTDALGHTTSIVYDDDNRLTTIVDSTGVRTVVSYNALGQPISVADALNNQWTLAYFGGDLSSTADPLHNTSTFAYDGAGRLETRSDPTGNTSRYVPDPLNNVLQVSDPLGNTIQYGYDPNENLTSLADPLHPTVPSVLAYDSMDHLQSRTDPLQHAETYQYDLNENLTCFKDRRGTFAVYKYDGINRRTFAGLGAASCIATTFQSTVSYSYDAGNRLKTAIDSISGQISRSYDNLDSLQSETTTLSGVTHTITYLGDVVGRRKSMTVDTQPIVSYSFDDANRITQISQGTANVTFAYDTAGRRTSQTLPNGVAAQYAYDANSRVTAIAYQLGGTTLGTLSYVYDSNGKIVQKTGTFAGTNLPGALASASYNANNQLTVRPATSYTYDLNGNLKTDGLNTYTWNERNQLASLVGGTPASSQYDALGRRVTKTIGGTTTGFLCDGDQPIEEFSGATATATLLTGPGIDEIYSRTDALGARFFLTDLEGSTVATTDSTGLIQASYTYEPFGATSSSGAGTNSFQYTGRENDGDGLYYYRARYYAPGIQRFISEDPIGFGGGPNVYAYVGNDPVGYTDPFGTRRRYGRPRHPRNPQPPSNPPTPNPPTPNPPTPNPPGPNPPSPNPPQPNPPQDPCEDFRGDVDECAQDMALCIVGTIVIGIDEPEGGIACLLGGKVCMNRQIRKYPQCE